MPDEQRNGGGLSMQEDKNEFDLEKAFEIGRASCRERV